MNGRRTLCSAICMLVLAGCGSAGPPGVVKQFFQAVNEEDFDRACNLLAEDARAPASLGGPCGTELIGMVDPNPSIPKEIDAGNFEVVEDSDRATVTMEKDLGTYHLIREDGEWRLSEF